MSKAIVKYHNDMNKINFSGINEKELNLFFSICFKAKEMGLNEITLTFGELRELSKGDINLPRFLKTLKSTYDKLIALPFHYRNEKGFGAFILFSKYFVNEIEKKVAIKLSEDFEYILNNLIGNFTKFELMEFVNLKSLYSKNIFKLLKQWDTTKEKEFLIEEFRNLLTIPEKYRMSEIDKKVLTPIMEELPQYFLNLKLEKIKTGKKVTSLKFTWGRPKQEILIAETVEIKISEKLEKAILKAKKNIHISKFLEDVHIKQLLEIFNEKELIKGLEYSYKSIKEDIKKLVYLENSIKKGIENSEIKIITEKNSDSEKIIELKVSKEKIEVTKEEYENYYQDYLKSNEKKNGKEIRASWEFSVKNKFEVIEEKITQKQEETQEYREYQEFLAWKKMKNES